MAVKIPAEVFWFVMLCSVETTYQCFRGPSHLQLQGGSMDSQMLVHYNTTQHHNSEDLDLLLLVQSRNIYYRKGKTTPIRARETCILWKSSHRVPDQLL